MAIEKYEAFLKESTDDRLPINEDELKKIHKTSRDQALSTFKKKVIGGDIEELTKNLKDKLKEVFSAYKNENERLTKTMSISFLTKYYGVIDKNLNAGAYKNFSEYELEIDNLINKFFESGPEGPNNKLFLYEFIVKSMINSTQYFINNCSNEIETNTKLNNHKIARLTEELAELKNSYSKMLQDKNDEVLAQFTEKDELTANLINIKEDLNTMAEEKEKNLTYFNERIENSKLNFERQIQELKNKILKHEEDNKVLERKLISSNAEFEKEKLLLLQKSEYQESKLLEYEKKEKQLNMEFMSIKKEQISINKERIKEFEDQLDQLSKKLLVSNEKISILENLLVEKERAFDKEKSTFEETIESLNTQLSDYSEKMLNKSDLLDKSNTKYKEEFSILQSETESKIQSFKETFEQQEKKLKEQEDAFKATKNKFVKENAMLKQDKEFLDLKIKELENQLADSKKTTDSIINTYETKSNLALQSQEEFNKKLEELKCFYLGELKKKESDHEKVRAKLQQQLDLHLEKKLDYESKLSSEKGDILMENEELKQKIEEMASEISLLTEKSKHGSKEKSKIFEEYNSKSQELIREYESKIEDMKLSHNKEIERINLQCEEEVKILKSIYQNEKLKFEKKEIADKLAANKKYNDMVDEFGKKYKDDIAEKDEEIERLQENIEMFSEQHREYMNQAENEISKQKQKIESLQKSIVDLKESHQKLIEVNNLNSKQQIDKLIEEKKIITAKCDSLLQEINKKDRENAGITSKKEQLEEFLTKKENLIEKLKNDFIAEQAEIEKKFNEMKEANQLITDEAVSKKLTAQRELALAQQHSDFQQKRIAELESVLEEKTKALEEEIVQITKNLESEFRIKLNHMTKEKEAIEAKLILKKKEFRESELNRTKQVSMMEKERAVINEKLMNVERKKQEIIENFDREKEILSNTIVALKENSKKENAELLKENWNLKQKLENLNETYSELVSSNDRDKLLWEEKFKFLEMQKEQYRTDLQVSTKKFEETLEKYQTKGNKDKTKFDEATNSMLSNLEMRHKNELKEVNESNQKIQKEMQTRLKELERENKSIMEKYQAELKSKSAFEHKFTQKFNAFQINEDKLKKEIEDVKAERDKNRTTFNLMNDKEISGYKTKVTDLEIKCKEAEFKRQQIFIESQKEAVKLEVEKNTLITKNQELNDKVDRLERQKEDLSKENEKLNEKLKLKKHMATGSISRNKFVSNQIFNTTNKENNNNNRLLDHSLVDDYYPFQIITPQNQNQNILFTDRGLPMPSRLFAQPNINNELNSSKFPSLKSEGENSCNISKDDI